MKYIELNAFLTVKGITSTGGQAKLLIREGKVQVNGELETRLRRKLIAGDEVSYEAKTLIVEEDILKMEKS